MSDPWPANAIKHEEALQDLLLDEEFSTVENHKKSWADIMTVGEMFEWVDGPLVDAFYSEDSLDQPGRLDALLGENWCLVSPHCAALVRYTGFSADSVMRQGQTI